MGYQIIPERLAIGEQDKPHESAALELKGLNKGLLLNRLTLVQRNAISSPASGLIIFNTDSQKLEFFDGIEWRTLGGIGEDLSIIHALIFG